MINFSTLIKMTRLTYEKKNITIVSISLFSCLSSHALALALGYALAHTTLHAGTTYNTLK